MSQSKDWYFTFGMGQPHQGCFIVFSGTYEEAREKMNHSFNRIWGFQYSEAEWFDEEGVSQEDRYGLRQIF